MISRLCPLLLLVGVALGMRAFPMASENYVIKLFQSINPNIEYDETNFLVDLSGRYVTCSRVGQRGALAISETQENGAPIYGLVDYGFGTESHVSAVNQYISSTLAAWEADPQFEDVIRGSTTFGCSVRPSCDNYYVVGCAFNGRRSGGGNYENTTPPQGGGSSGIARAFTEAQYFLSESITGVDWDRSHFLENLSGGQTECAMILQPEWNWEKSQKLAYDLEGIRVTGVTGSALNRGETEPAMVEIISTIAPKLYKSTFKSIGCSLIPDCVFSGELYVVIGCLYSS